MLGPMIMRSDNAPGRRRLRAGRRCGAAAGWPRVRDMRHFAVAGYWASAQHHRAGPGALLPARRPARAAAQPRLRAPAARPRSCPSSAGASPAHARRAGFTDLPQGRLARHRRRPAGARGGAVRARRHALRDGGADRRQPHARLRHRDAARRGRADLPPRGASRRAPAAARRAGAAPRRPSRTCSPAPPASAWSWPTAAARNLTGRRLPGYCRPWAYLLRPGRRGSRAGAARPAPPRARPPGARRLPPRARLARARALGAPQRAARSSWAPTSRGAAATTPAAPWT